MQQALIWALTQAREQTLGLAADIPSELACDQTAPGEHHPTWIAGHLLLGDSYLLFLLAADQLPGDFQLLLQRYGPGATPTSDRAAYHSLDSLIDRLVSTGAVRQRVVAGMSEPDLARPVPDAVLASVQPTMGHHLLATIGHEGYHGGQLAAWRRTHRLAPGRWAFGPRSG
jgi:hypothetical protein